jgi:hypothetical protein
LKARSSIAAASHNLFSAPQQILSILSFPPILGSLSDLSPSYSSQYSHRPLDALLTLCRSPNQGITAHPQGSFCFLSSTHPLQIFKQGFGSADSINDGFVGIRAPLPLIRQQRPF